MKHLTLLGSTGSIGCSTLDVVRHNPDSYTVAALVAGKTCSEWSNSARVYPRFAVMDDEESARRKSAVAGEGLPYRGAQRATGGVRYGRA